MVNVIACSKTGSFPFTRPLRTRGERTVVALGHLTWKRGPPISLERIPLLIVDAVASWDLCAANLE